MRTQRPNQQHAPRGKEREQKKLFARDVMTPHVGFIEPGATIREAARKLSELDVGSLPVCDAGRLVGMITDRDIVVRVVANDQSRDGAVSDVMSPDVLWAYDDEDLPSLVERMRRREVRRVPVVDREEKLVGIIALADLANSDAPDRLKAKGLEGVS